MKADIYGRARSLAAALEKVKESGEIGRRNRQLILDFDRQCTAEGLSVARRAKYAVTLLRLAKALHKPFDKASRQSMVDLVAEIEANDSWAAWTKQHYKVTLKKFYKWLHGCSDPGQYPEEVSWIRTTVKAADSLLPDQVLTEDEVRRMAETATNARDKALVLVLYESGCRVGELVPLAIKDIALDENGAVLMVSGKTGARRVRIIGAAPALAGWLQMHPAKDNPDSPLWVNLATNLRGQPLGYRGFFQVLKGLATQAGIKKHVNPKAFRHARATFLANRLSDAQMRQLFGWTQSSKMTAVYVHLSGRDVDNALLQLHGLAPRGRTRRSSRSGDARAAPKRTRRMRSTAGAVRFPSMPRQSNGRIGLWMACSRTLL